MGKASKIDDWIRTLQHLINQPPSGGKPSHNHKNTNQNTNTMKTETYNGWTNYATWRVNLEIFDNWNDDPMDADTCQEFAEMIVIESTPELENTLAEGYIRSFLSDVNWHEIAEAINQN